MGAHPPDNQFTEDSFIRFLTENFQSSQAAVGIGDDCAVLPVSTESSLLITTDALIENTHFRRAWTSAHDLGYKSLAVNLSDIAAMGGTPKYVLLSLGLPAAIDFTWPRQFMSGVKEILDEFQVELIGGDTVRSEDIYISVTALGEVPPARIKTRNAARPGDLICVSKTLGDSHLGLEALRQGLHSGDCQDAIERHRRPLAEVEAGVWLSRHPEVHAMMDLSDGLRQDLPRLATASACRMVVDVEKLPLSSVAEKLKIDAVEAAVNGGEDYALLFTVDAAAYEKIEREFRHKLRRPLYAIGSVTDGDGAVFRQDGHAIEITDHSFAHFARRDL